MNRKKKKKKKGKGNIAVLASAFIALTSLLPTSSGTFCGIIMFDPVGNLICARGETRGHCPMFGDLHVDGTVTLFCGSWMTTARARLSPRKVEDCALRRQKHCNVRRPEHVKEELQP